MKTITINLYNYSELSDKSKEVAKNWYLESSLNDNWWSDVYEDAKDIGLEIEGFNLDRGMTIDGGLMVGLMDTIDKILANHGEGCSTYTLAKEYKIMADNLPKAETQENEEAAMELEESFERELKAEYLLTLRKVLKDLESDEYIAETMEVNEYTFEENGARRD